MSEVMFLALAATAAAFKAIATIVGIIRAFRCLLTQHGAPLNYRYARTEPPYRVAFAGR